MRGTTRRAPTRQRLRGHRRPERPAHPLRQPLPWRLIPVGPPHAATRSASTVARPHHRRLPRTGPGRLGIGGTDEPMAGRGRRRPPRPRGVLGDQILERRRAQCPRPASDLRSAHRHERHLPALRRQHLGLHRLPGVRRRPVPGLPRLRVRRTSAGHLGLLRLPSGERQGPVPLPSLDSLPRLRVITRPVRPTDFFMVLAATAGATRRRCRTRCCAPAASCCWPPRSCSGGERAPRSPRRPRAPSISCTRSDRARSSARPLDGCDLYRGDRRQRQQPAVLARPCA